MRRPMRALLILEVRQAAWASILASALMTGHFYTHVSNDALDGVPNLTPNTFFFFSLVMLALTVSYRQTNREGRGDMWAFAMHRPASGAQIFGAKVIVGMGSFVLAIVLAAVATKVLVATQTLHIGPIDRTYWLPGIVDGLALLTFCAAGFYAGVSRERSGGRWIGLVLAIGGWVASQAVSSFALALCVSLLFTTFITAGAFVRFTKPDFRAQPWWGRVANVIGGIAAVMTIMMIATGVRDAVTHQAPQIAPRPWLPKWPFATITQDGRIALVPKEQYRGMVENDVISSSQIAIDRRSTAEITRKSYRDATTWVTPLFTALQDGPKWYYQRRVGLISIRDRKTGALMGWLGPDGYSEGERMPAARFSGSIQTKGMQATRRAGLLVLSGSVYVIDELLQPTLIFTAPEGETILGASQGLLYSGAAPRPDLPWGWFNVITTEKHTYVADRVGKIQITVANPAADSNRVVNVYRAPYGPGSPTFVWFRPRDMSPTDSLNEVFEFRVGQGQVAQRRFATMPNVISTSLDDEGPRNVSLSGNVPFVPVVQVYALTLEMPPAVRRAALPAAVGSVLVCLALAALAFWACRRHGLSSRVAMIWTVLTALIGPAALIVMWVFVELPEPTRPSLSVAAAR